MGRSYFHLHLVSDSTGETLIAVGRAVAAQYEGISAIEHVYQLVRSRAQLERVVSGVGLAKFGAVGDPFDPTIHEALSHIGEDPEVEVTTCKVIAKAGYKIGERVVRAAQVLVVDPAAESATETPAGGDDDTEAESDD